MSASRCWTIEARVDGGKWVRQDDTDGYPGTWPLEYVEVAVEQLNNDAAGTRVEFRAVEFRGVGL